MTSLNSIGRFINFFLLWTLLSFAASLHAYAGSVPNSKFRTITPSGKQITSIFDGRPPSEYVRRVLILRKYSAAVPRLPDSDQQDLAQLFKRFKASPSMFLGCPAGSSNCGPPGTTSGGTYECKDSLGCDVILDSQTNTNDLTQGVMESYYCEQCCVDWNGCDVDLSTCDAVPLPGSLEPNVVECGPSPIIIDTEGEGFHLTSAGAGVTFDISGNGHPLQMGWTDPHFHNAFLALPGPDGLVHNGRDLFGDFTPQPPSDHPNGFLALAQYDKPESGGNGDGIIDERDQVFSQLRLWIDENHDGICQPNELHRLPELGVYSLALSYTESPRTDQFGNNFRYKSRVNPGERRDSRDEKPTGDPGRRTYDVFFVTK